MTISKKRSLNALLFLIISLPFQTNAMMGPQVNITDYKSIFSNFIRQASESFQNAFSYIAASFSSSVTTTAPSLPKKVSAPSFSFSATPKWVMLASAVLVAGTVALKTDAFRKFLKYIHEKSPFSKESFAFTQLPQDERNIIILQLTTNSYATTLKEAAQTINSLSQVNKILNLQLNNPKFCLSLIKSLAKQFECSHEKAAKALHTKGAKNWLEVEMPLQELCSQIPLEEGSIWYNAEVMSNPTSLKIPKNMENKLHSLISLSVQNWKINFDFTYTNPTFGSFNDSFDFLNNEAFTPLMLTLKKYNFFLAEKLLKYKDGSDINYVTPKGETALTYFTININDNWWNEGHEAPFAPIEFLLRQKTINIDKKIPPYSDTALIKLAKNPYPIAEQVLQLLLDAGADPTLLNDQKESAESLISKSDIHKIHLPLIEKAKKEKKWEKLSQ